MDSFAEIGSNAEEGLAIASLMPSYRLPTPQTNCVGHFCPDIQGRGADAGDDGHKSCETQTVDAVIANNSVCESSGGRVGRTRPETHMAAVDSAIILEIEECWRRRNLWLNAEVRLALQAFSVCLRLTSTGDKKTHKVDKKEAGKIFDAAQGDGEHPLADIALGSMFPLIAARKNVEVERVKLEKHCEKLAKQLHVAEFIKTTKGASFRALASIIGEAGNLSKYGNPGKLWKRMGLAPYQSKAYSTWRRDKGLSSAEWEEAGYKPLRRSAMFIVGGGLIGGMGRGKRPLVGQSLDDTDWSPMEKLFVERLRHEAARDPENMSRPTTEAGKESFSKWAALRAQRYVEKRFLKLLWSEWRRQAQDEAIPTIDLPAAN